MLVRLILIPSLLGLWMADVSAAQDSPCSMVDASGRVVNLESLCNVPRPVPSRLPKTTPESRHQEPANVVCTLPAYTVKIWVPHGMVSPSCFSKLVRRVATYEPGYHSLEGYEFEVIEGY
ncbi:hypothetical protein DO97_09685 [Neosynechococcus sphagnicola sy1]|uniref:Uncharacterized protein n=1 Tax=Neosynechococcus sphagnicola sy1 TaxID=1497020 RepID=A0A098TIE7_9CYAN|nr:hypothetical protein [Neosynechococcus sphagnicola]KGF72350.1 hypothetical protein DO97_09685 [Neosynechococcus sphagnicola sy1]